MEKVFSPFVTQELKEHCMDLINRSVSFTVTIWKDVNGQPHHWVVKDNDDATE